MKQGQMFPMTEEERIAILHSNLTSDVEKRLAKRDAAAVALADAQEAEDGARGLLSVFDHMVRDRARQMSQDQGGKSILEEVADEVNAGALDGDGVTVTARVSPGRVIDPWTCPDCAGDPAWYDKTGHTCTTCDGTGHKPPSCDNCTAYGDCNISQPPGSDTMGCGGKSWLHGEMMGDAEIKGGEVLVAWPDNLDMQRMEVGPLTRYGELAAKFLNSLPGDDPRRTDSFLDYRVVCLGGPFCTDLEERALDTVIAPADYGLEFRVEDPAKVEETAS